MTTLKADDKEESPLLTKNPSTGLLITTGLTLIFMALSSSIGSSIRYGFLVISCTKRGIPGSIYGLIETSKVLGYLAAFSMKCYTTSLTAKLSPKWIIEGTWFIIVASLIISGAAEFFEDNDSFLALSIAMRIIQGFACFYLHVAIVDFSHYYFLKDFDRVNGLLQLGYFSGHGIGQWMGVILYERYGYFIPFLAAGITMFFQQIISLIVLPASPSYASVAPCTPPSSDSTACCDEEPDNPSSVSWWIVMPFMSVVTVNSIYNFLQIDITPYLVSNFDISMTLSGSVLTCASFGMGIGSVFSGQLTHSRLFSTTSQMVVGALMVGVGILFIFPDPAVTVIYSHPLAFSYPAVLLASLGDPILTIPALRAMKEVQMVTNGSLSPRQAIRISEVWLVGTKCASYMGSLIAGVLNDDFEIYESAYVLSILCCISMLFSIGLKLFVLKDCKDIDVP